MRENEVEKQFVEAVRAAGGQALKFTSQSMNGVPDRLVLLLGGKCAFVELKAPGKQMRILQRKRRQQLEALGFPVFCVDRLEQIQVQSEHFTVPYGQRFSEGEFRKRVQFMYGGRLRTVHFLYKGPSVEAVLDRLPTAEIVGERDGTYEIRAEVFGKGIDMWMKSQGAFVEIL